MKHKKKQRTQLNYLMLTERSFIRSAEERTWRVKMLGLRLIDPTMP